MSITARFKIGFGHFNLNVALSVPAYGVTAVYGPSGSGKTTLLRAFAGLESCRGGFLKVGDDIWQDDRLNLSPHRRPLGYVFQEASLFGHLSVRDNLEFGLKRIGKSERRIDFEQTVAMLGLGSLLTRSSATLSGGERQRVAIGRALLTSPRLVLMDEPLASLDAASKAELLPYFDRLHEELDIPVLYVSHSADEVARLADHLVLLEAGRVVASGPIAEMLTRVDLPMSHANDAAAVIEACVSGCDDEFDLTYLDFSGGCFAVPGIEIPEGNKVRLRILARDVSLTLQKMSDSSILNIFPAQVEEMSDTETSQVLIRLRSGNDGILARITRKSAAMLAVKPGSEVYVQIKSIALLT